MSIAKWIARVLGGAEEDAAICEICGSSDVQRRGDWDHCAVGHVYVGKRAGTLPTEYGVGTEGECALTDAELAIIGQWVHPAALHHAAEAVERIIDGRIAPITGAPNERLCSFCGSQNVIVTRGGAVIHNGCTGSVR